jgi:hypothetical protein
MDDNPYQSTVHNVPRAIVRPTTKRTVLWFAATAAAVVGVHLLEIALHSSEIADLFPLQIYWDMPATVAVIALAIVGLPASMFLPAHIVVSAVFWGAVGAMIGNAWRHPSSASA